MEEKKISEAFAVVEEDELQKKKEAMVLICYSTGSREILGYIPLVFGRAAK